MEASLAGLPGELLSHVGSFLSDERDFGSLLQTSKVFNSALSSDDNVWKILFQSRYHLTPQAQQLLSELEPEGGRRTWKEHFRHFKSGWHHTDLNRQFSLHLQDLLTDFAPLTPDFNSCIVSTYGGYRSYIYYLNLQTNAQRLLEMQMGDGPQAIDAYEGFAVTAQSSTNAQVIDFRSGQEEGQSQTVAGRLEHGEQICEVKLQEDKIFTVGSQRIKVWDRTRHEEVCSATLPHTLFRKICLHGEHTVFISGWDKNLHLWDIREPVVHQQATDCDILQMELDSHTQLLATMSAGSVTVRPLAKLSSPMFVGTFTETMSSLAFNGMQNALLTGTRDGNLYWWDFMGGNSTPILKTPTPLCNWYEPWIHRLRLKSTKELVALCGNHLNILKAERTRRPSSS
jgi:WD40 repeat protein